MFQKIFGNVNGIDKQLMTNVNNKTYLAKLALFTINLLCRGKGIVEMLF